MFSSGTRVHVLHVNVHKKCQNRYRNIIWYSLNFQVLNRYLERSARDNQREPRNSDKKMTTLHSPHPSDPQTSSEQHPFPLAAPVDKSRPEETSQRQTARQPREEVLSGNVERQHQVRPKEFQGTHHKRFHSGTERLKGHTEPNFNNPETSPRRYGKATSRADEKMTETTFPLKASGSSKADDRPKHNRETPVSQTEAGGRSPRMECQSATCQKLGRCCSTEVVRGESLESALWRVNKTPIC